MMTHGIGRNLRAALLVCSLELAGRSAAWAQIPTPTLAVTDAANHATQLALTEIEALPLAEATISDAHGTTVHATGPLLWTVLEHGGALDQNFHKRLHQVLTVTGSDGYSALLALAEIDPEFENKPVLLTIDRDRRVLRLVVPGDKRPGRDVREVVGVTVH